MRPLYPRSVYPRTLLATTIALALSSAAMAQEVAPDTANENDYIEEITVTAQMREQSVMDVPVTMDDEMDAPLNGVNAPNWLTHTQLKGNVRHEN